MTPPKPTMKIPELIVFFKSLAVGFLSAEVYRIAFYLGENFAPKISDVAPWAIITAILMGVALCLIYALNRHAHVTAIRMGRSLRIDLLLAVTTGIWTDELVAPWLEKVHTAVKGADSHWAPMILIFLSTVLFSSLVQYYWPRSKKIPPQRHFIADEEVRGENEDLLASKGQAKSFAETVLASGVHTGLVFGVDGPWGVGKTSFINLAERYWKNAEDRVIVCRFEPLRYASEPDLADRLIRELSTVIQRKVFVPEFRPAASRYSRLIKGKADFSFLGFKLSLEPSQEAVDDLLDDIDDVLRRIGHRVIIVIDDLDRLDAKTINNVLFATRKTFKLSQATYVLCYDTEVLAGGKDENSRAREFLEKFVTVKLSLFVDSSCIRDFLLRDWQLAENQMNSIPSYTMVKLGAVLNELASILDNNLAAKYLPLVGDLRKVKRFVNAMLLMQMEKSDLGRTDFNKRDLINLMLLHLNYPGLFRRIYAEETEGRSGTFSVRREIGKSEYKNSDEFEALIKNEEGAASFLLSQLFDVTTLKLGEPNLVNDAFIASRACFNHHSARNLEGYLKLIVRFATPEPQKTFVLYQKAVERALRGDSIDSILKSPDFGLERGEYSHSMFWSVFVNQSHGLTNKVVDSAIDTLVNYLPKYSTNGNLGSGLRQGSIYSLLLLLDRVGWGRRSGGNFFANTNENVIEIAWRIFGEQAYEGSGLLQRLVGSNRGVLGWNDLMLFRLQCSADRQGQLFNLHKALILNQDVNAETAGSVTNLALLGMRKLSQEVFSLFKNAFIDKHKNFFSEVNNTPDSYFLGEGSCQSNNTQPEQSALDVSSARSSVKSFVIYQLSNQRPPDGSGVGCGYYDESGIGDHAGIAKIMNKYIFGVCFNPKADENNIFHFLDHCLSHLSSSFFFGRDVERSYIASKLELPGGLEPKEIGLYWNQNQELIRQRVLQIEDRFVTTPNYRASYSQDLPGVFSVLDEIAEEAITA